MVDEPNPISPLIGMPQCVVTPHLGASTFEAQDKVGLAIAEEVINVLGGKMVPNAVNLPAIAATELERYAAKMQKKTGLRPQSPHPAKSPEIAVPALHIKETDAEENPLFSADMKRQMKGLFDRMASSLILEVHENESSASKELERYIKNLCSLTDKISYQKGANSTEAVPFVAVLRAEGEPTGLLYYGVPGGHEFTPFLLGLYNAAGPGQPLSEHDRAAILALPAHEIDLIVSLTCRICPDVVTVAQHIAALNPKITVRVRDLVHQRVVKLRIRVKIHHEIFHPSQVPAQLENGHLHKSAGGVALSDQLVVLFLQPFPAVIGCHIRERIFLNLFNTCKIPHGMQHFLEMGNTPSPPHDAPLRIPLDGLKGAFLTLIVFAVIIDMLRRVQFHIPHGKIKIFPVISRSVSLLKVIDL